MLLKNMVWVAWKERVLVNKKMQEMACLLHCTAKFFQTSIASLDPEKVQLPTFYILSTMFTGARGLPGKLRPALVKHSNVLCMIVKLHGLF